MRNEGDYLRGLFVHALEAEGAAHKALRGVTRARSHLAAVRALAAAGLGNQHPHLEPLLATAEAAADAATASASAWDAAVVSARALVGSSASVGPVGRSRGGGDEEDGGGEEGGEEGGADLDAGTLAAALSATLSLHCPVDLASASAAALVQVEKAHARVRAQAVVVDDLALQARDLVLLGAANFRVAAISSGVADAVTATPAPDLRPWVRATRALAAALS